MPRLEQACLAGGAQGHVAERDGRGQRAYGPAGGVVGVVAGHGGVNGSLTTPGAHDAVRWVET